MEGQIWSWVLTLVGLAGFFLAGKKVWWCWYVNIANQILWFTYALITEQWGFLVGVFAYLFVFVKNAYEWTREHFEESPAPERLLPVSDEPWEEEMAEKFKRQWLEKYGRRYNCQGDWDMAHKSVHPQCRILNIPHEPHDV